jgi:outer membrane lipoprotein LolB
VKSQPTATARRGFAPRDALVASLAGLLLAACAAVPPQVSTSADAPLVAVDRFDIAGRLSARRGSEGVAAHFTWSHRPDGDRIDVATPMGQTVARLSGDAAGVRVERPGQAPLASASWDVLTREVFGVPIPVEGLAAWVVGAPRADLPFGNERDAAGRLSVLRQSGWEIVYAYADGTPPTRPTRLVMRYPDTEIVEVRLVVDRWNETSAP